MSDDIEDYLSNALEFGWLDPEKENKVTCWDDEGRVYEATITFKEVDQ